MAKTVKELINFYLSNGEYMSENECLKFEKILIAYGKEIDEKDKEIDFLKNDWIIKKNNFIELEDEIIELEDKIFKLKQQQLYKEDFKEVILLNSNDYILKDNSDYNQLPSKENE